MTLLAFLLATVGGVSALIAYTLTAQLRSWDRIVVFIDFFALGVLALMLDAVARRWFQDRRLLAAIGLVVLCLFGVFDQSSRNAVPDYKLVTRNWNSDAQFVERIQRTLPRNAAVFELPYVTFPEAVPFNGIQSYDQLRGWLHSTTLSWSFGAMVDRPADWAGQTTALPTRTLLDALVAAGFDGITIDDHGYPGNTSPVTPELEQILHEQPVTAPNGRYLFFDIRHYAAMLRAHVSHAELAGLRTAVLHPPLSTITAGIYGGGVDGTSTWAVNTVQMSVVNHAAKARRVVFYAEVRAAAPGNYTLDVALAGGGRHRFRFSNHQRLLEFALTLAPGASTLTLDTNVPPTLIPGTSAPVSVWYSSPLVVGAAMRPFLPRSAAAALQ
jgi:phosphoglycerol transferase